MSNELTSPRPAFRERLRRMRSKRNEDWWSIVFGGPIGTVLGALVAEVQWITPNRVTLLAFVCKLAAVPLILAGSRHHGYDIAAIIVLQLNVILDCMDGSLARYRRRPSFLGAFLDKLTDAVGLLLVLGAAGVRAHELHGDLAALLLPIAGAAGYITRSYAYWVVAFFEREHGAARPTVGPAKRQDFGELGFGARLAYYVKATPRILNFAEADAYGWLGLSLVFHDPRWFCWIFGTGMAVQSLAILGYRTITVARLDRSPS